jgi:polysaccharide export outer membrane protein
MTSLTKRPFVIAGMAALLVLSACALPRSGPSRGEILAGAKEDAGVHILDVTDSVAQAARSVETLGFDSSFLNAAATRADRISAGDVLSVTVWENVDNGLLASVGQKVTFIQDIQVDQNGSIFVPYAGNLKASGKTPEELRRLVTQKLEGQTPDPQVEVRRLAGDGSTVSLIGGVAAQGVYPIEPSTRRLTAMLAKAGGAQIKIQRHGKTGSIWLQDLYDSQMADIALRAGDRIVVEEDRRSFTALGATGGQTQVPFSSKDLSVIEALAQVGGLNSQLADPKGIFVFREEPSYVANRVLGRTDIVTPQRFAYVVDLTKPNGMFTARDFNIRDGDTIYITEAPFVGWEKILSATIGTINFAGAAITVSDSLNN